MRSKLEHSAPLPHPDCIDHRTRDIEHFCEVYHQLLQLEHAVIEPAQNYNLILIRVLGYLILEGPTDTVRASVVEELWECRDDEQSYLRCGERYLQFFIQPFMRSHNDNDDETSSGENSPSVGDVIMNVEIEFTGHEKAKIDALRRDNYRCLITRAYDWMNGPEPMATEGPRRALSTQCTYIIPDFERTMASETDAEKREETRASASKFWDILNSFGYGPLREMLDGDQIHRLENILTLNCEAHQLFDYLELWFESTDQPNTYKVCIPRASSRNMLHSMGMQDVVTFVSSDPERYPLPSSELLATHATCSRVYWFSGAAGYFRNLL